MSFVEQVSGPFTPKRRGKSIDEVFIQIRTDNQLRADIDSRRTLANAPVCAGRYNPCCEIRLIGDERFDGSTAKRNQSNTGPLRHIDHRPRGVSHYEKERVKLTVRQHRASMIVLNIKREQITFLDLVSREDQLRRGQGAGSRFVKSDPGMARALATRLGGSPDLYRGSGRAPWHSINFVTCHDGFTLGDLVSYDEKHNEANGEENRDGHPENLSWNCGVEGPSSSPDVNALRARQTRNFLTLLFISQGVPMLLGGDELGRTQRGNNNAWCQDNDISWMDWSLLEKNAELFRFTSRLVRFRKAHPSLRRRTFFEDDAKPPVAWHGLKLGQPDWRGESRVLGMFLKAVQGDEAIYLFANAHWEPQRFELPALRAPRRWRLFVDTSLEPGADAVEPGSEVLLPSAKTYVAGPRSVVILVGRG